jgi:alpha-glucosidase
MRMSVPMSLTLGLSGQPFSGPDIGGFLGTPPSGLWGDWIGFGAFFPFCRGHACAGTPPKEPWAFGKETEDAARIALDRRYRLLPYLYTLFQESSTTGLPVMRPVFLADPKDPALRAEDQAFLLGRDLLVVPAFAQKPALPGGLWQPLSLVEGDGGKYQAALKLRGGAILPAGKIVESTNEKSLDPLTLYVALDGAGKAEGTLYLDAGDGWDFRDGDDALLRFSALREGKTVTVRLDGQDGKRDIGDLPVRVEVLTRAGRHSASGTLRAPVTVPL